MSASRGTGLHPRTLGLPWSASVDARLEQRKKKNDERGLNGHSGFELRSISDVASRNGLPQMGKTVAEAFASSGFSLTPRLAGGEEIRDPYVESWVVYSCLHTISSSVEQVGFKVRTSDDRNAPALPPTHPVVKLFSRPNPWTSWSQLVSMGSIHRNLNGEDFWFLTDSQGQPIVMDATSSNPMAPIPLPAAIYSLSGALVQDVRDAQGRVVNWFYNTSQGGKSTFPAASVLHFRNYDPADPCRGIGPAEVAMRQLSIAYQAERYGEATLRSGGPGAFVVFEYEMSPDTLSAFQAEVDQALSDPRNVGKMKVLTGKPKVIPIPQSPKDMMSIEQLKWSRDAVASVFGVPLPIIGVFEKATYSNMKEAWRQFWLRISAYLKTVEDVINSSFFPRMVDASLRGLRFSFDLSNIPALRADESELVKLAAETAAKGIGVSMNDGLRLLGTQGEPLISGDARLFLAQFQTGPNPPRPSTGGADPDVAAEPDPNDPNESAENEPKSMIDYDALVEAIMQEMERGNPQEES